MRFWSKPESEVQERVEALNDAELDWISENTAAARTMIEEAGIDDHGELTPEGLDELWARLRNDPSLDPNATINVVGLALGQVLVDRLGLEWVAITDEHGTEVAVRGPSSLTIFPTGFVAKRFETGETGFIAPFVDEATRTLGQLTG